VLPQRQVEVRLRVFRQRVSFDRLHDADDRVRRPEGDELPPDPLRLIDLVRGACDMPPSKAGQADVG